MDDRKFMESTSLWIWSERDAGILWEPQGFIEMRVIKYVPEPIDDLTIGPRSIRKHTLIERSALPMLVPAFTFSHTAFLTNRCQVEKLLIRLVAYIHKIRGPTG
jgi:hypothetical protein